MDFDFLLLAQSIKMTNWLTPVWLISTGIGLGFILVLLMMLKIWVFQRVPFFNGVWENPTLRGVFGILTGFLYLALFVGWLYWTHGFDFLETELVLPIGFAIPICLTLGFGVWALVSRRMIGETGSLFREGFSGWLNIFCVAALGFAIIGAVLAPFDGFGIAKFVDNPMEFVDSLQRIPHTGKFTTDGENVSRFYTEPMVVPPNLTDADGNPRANEDGSTPYGGDQVLVDFDGQELEWITFQSDERVEIAVAPINKIPSAAFIFDVTPSDESRRYIQRSDGKGMIPSTTYVDYLYVRNPGKNPANVRIEWNTTPLYGEVFIIPSVAAFIVAIYLFYFVLATLCPKIYAIAHSTFKTEVGQPLYLLVMIIGAVFIVGSIYVPYNTFGEDIKMYKDSGLTLIRVLAIFLAIWAASKSVAEEIEGRTALTVLSKPVGRRQFILGKFSGISLAIGLLFILLGFWFIAWTAYKPIYDYQEASKGLCEWTECFRECIHIAPGLFLCFLEVLVFVAISVAISTRFGILANFLICFSIYVLGHLTPLLVQSSYASFEPVVVFGQLVAIVFPVLNHYDVQAAINTNSPVPFSYLGWSVIYTALYGSMALLLALVFFEDRDLA